MFVTSSRAANTARYALRPPPSAKKGEKDGRAYLTSQGSLLISGSFLGRNLNSSPWRARRLTLPPYYLRTTLVRSLFTFSSFCFIHSLAPLHSLLLFSSNSHFFTTALYYHFLDARTKPVAKPFLSTRFAQHSFPRVYLSVIGPELWMILHTVGIRFLAQTH